MQYVQYLRGATVARKPTFMGEEVVGIHAEPLVVD